MPDHLVVRVLVAASIAAYRVPAAAILWTLGVLARDTDLADRCAQASYDAADGEEPEVVGSVRREALRLWPPTWMLFREAHGDQVCAGWRLRSGSAIMMSPYVVHRLAPCFDDRPDDFVPQRWRDLRPAPGEYLPFGSGSRRCVGAQLAELEMATAVRTMVTRLELSTSDPAPKPLVRTTMVPDSLVLRTAARTPGRRTARSVG
jgi:unspecific monooxygenase